MKSLIKKFMPMVDVLLAPFVYVAARVLRVVRRFGVKRVPLCKSILFKVGIFPIINHYYEPQFNFTEKEHSFSDERELPGIDWNVKGQLELLESLSFSQELENTPISKVDDLHFYFDNPTFGSGDAEYWYQLIRLKKPKNIIEIGSGHSTLMAINAICKNEDENSEYKCQHICIEPYEMPWLEKTKVTVVRKKVEDVNVSFFSKLDEGDVLFIDSSHMIRPDGDVVFEYLQLLPTLKKGVIVHVHDIFSPRNYPDAWLRDDIRFWNEQYLLEAFLTHNSSWKIIASLNYLQHNHYEKLKEICPFLNESREPGSFYLQKTA
ncbi:MAG: class I SAM-dependent methyltransferase [Xanthomonadales bacterium]|nr:class I SAM-dependent methyltransferase [Xanthomonadales bacterium]